MENIVDKQQMESLKALSDINLKVSEAQNLLFTLQEQETEYLVTREKKAGDRVQKVIEDSREMVSEADKNHAQIKELSNGVSEFAGKLIKIHENLQGLITEFEERNVEWNLNIGKQQDSIEEIRKQQNIIRVQLENDRKTIDSANKKLADDQKKLDSDRGTIQRTINRLKENRI